MSLLLVIPYHKKDADLTRKLLDWMGQLQDHYAPHACLMIADGEVPQETRVEFRDKARKLFVSGDAAICRVPEAQQKWPDGPNAMFAAAARQIAEAYRWPWLWLEPDATPIRTGWLDEIEKEYNFYAKRILGNFIPSNGEADMPPVALSGVAVYPADIYHGIKQFLSTPGKAFDITASTYTVPRAQESITLQHFWGKKNLPPTFNQAAAPDGENLLTLSHIKPMTQVFHRCKDGSLIDVLRQKANSPILKQAVATELPASPLLESETT
jgi:hypothetical protein